MRKEIDQQKELYHRKQAAITHTLSDLNKKKEKDDEGHHQFRSHEVYEVWYHFFRLIISNH